VYPEGGEPEAGGADYGGGIRQRLGFHLEAVIPLILIIVILFFLAVKFGAISCNTPIVGPVACLIDGQDSPKRMLIIGNSSMQTLDALNQADDLVDYVVRDASAFGRNPADQLAQYDIVMLDQSQQADKTVPRVLGEDLADYVRSGGKLIVVMDSGIYREGAPDIVGWESTFDDIVPVKCDRVLDNQPVCERSFFVHGVIRAAVFDHDIMKGVDQIPADPMRKINLDTFDVSVSGKELAYIDDPSSGRNFPGIVEKNLIIGKSIYFNYNPGETPGVLENTIRYLS